MARFGRRRSEFCLLTPLPTLDPTSRPGARLACVSRIASSYAFPTASDLLRALSDSLLVSHATRLRCALPPLLAPATPLARVYGTSLFLVAYRAASSAPLEQWAREERVDVSALCTRHAPIVGGLYWLAAATDGKQARKWLTVIEQAHAPEVHRCLF